MIRPHTHTRMRPLTVTASDHCICQWVIDMLGMQGQPCDYEPYETIGVQLGNRLIAGVIYNELTHYPHGSTVQGTIATTDPKWLTRRTLSDFFRYPFVTLGVSRLWFRTSRKNRKVRRMADRLGFRHEGVLRRDLDGRTDSVVMSMLPEECRWIARRTDNGF